MIGSDRIITVYALVDAAAVAINLIIILLIIFGKDEHAVFIGKTRENIVKRRLFIAMCSIGFTETAWSFIKDILYFTTDKNEVFFQETGTRILVITDMFLSDAGCMILVLLWLLFVDYSIYRSEGHIRKHYPPYIAVTGIIVAAYALALFIVLFVFSGQSSWTAGLLLLCTAVPLYVIQCVFAVKAYRIAANYEKDRNPPLFLRLYVFVLPVVAGSILGNFVFEGFQSLGFAIGLLLTLYIQGKRNRYLDPDTGFYNRDFLQVMQDYLEKKGYLKGTGVVFSAPGRTNDLATAAEKMHADNSELFLLPGGDVLLTSGEQDDDALNLIIRVIREYAAKADPPYEVDAKTAIRYDGESAKEYTTRLLNLASRGEV